jgi:hypothetical protein
MLAIIAAICFAIAAIILFGALSGISALGLIAVGLALLALHMIPWNPIKRG